MLPGSPEAIFAILRTACAPAPDPRLADVLEAFRRHWLAVARKRYPGLRDDVEDAVQNGLLKLVSPEKLDRLQDVTRLEAWARSIFVNTVLDLVRDERRRHRRRLYIGLPDEDPEDALREQLPAEAPTPEEMAAFGERLRIVSRCVESFEVARLKFVDDLPDREIAARQNLTRDGVAGQLKRIRRGLRRVLGDSE